MGPASSTGLYPRDKNVPQAPLMRVLLTGGSPQKLLDCVLGFSVTALGTYYYGCPRSDATSSELRLLDSAGRDRLIATLERVAHFDGAWGPSVSPHGTDPLHEGGQRGLGPDDGRELPVAGTAWGRHGLPVRDHITITGG